MSLTILLLGLAFAALVPGMSGCVFGGDDGADAVKEVVNTSAGPIRGEEAPPDEDAEDRVLVYRGVPYAAAPAGDLRWRPSEAPDPWEETRPAVDFGPRCPQDEETSLVYELAGQRPIEGMDEDCLSLNVWTPAREVSDGLPVMVWIHGGSFVSGSGANPFYDGVGLARLGVVVVTLNYRLGALGFAAHPEMIGEAPEGAAGNWGLHDQVRALEWVSENIEKFGGDPNNVTLFGESAGGVSVAALMSSGAADGLFHKAIVQSGAAPQVLRPLADSIDGLESAEELGTELAERALAEADETDVTPSSAEALSRLRALPWEVLRSAWAEIQTSEGREDGGLPSATVGQLLIVDGVILREAPGEVIARGDQADVPLLIGTVADEGTLFVRELGIDTLDEYGRLLDKLFGDRADEVRALYPAETGAEVFSAAAALVGDLIFQRDARFLAAHQAAIGEPVYRYVFARVAPLIQTSGLGALHASEIPYVFGTLPDRPGVDEIDEEISSTMMRYWVRFARTGDPNGRVGVPGNGDALGQAGPEWESYDPSADNYLRVDEETGTRRGFRTEKLDLLDEVADPRRLAVQ